MTAIQGEIGCSKHNTSEKETVNCRAPGTIVAFGTIKNT
jgi:hypothetical protein